MSNLVWPVSSHEYKLALWAARAQSDRIQEATTSPKDMPNDALYLLSTDEKSGFGVTEKGELIGLFSLVPGRGKEMVEEAIAIDGVSYLDCFDGFLPSYYQQFGFVEYKRKPNWVDGGPDVVYMRMQDVPPPVSDLS